MSSGAAVTLARVVSALDASGIPHMIVGSFASTLYGDDAVDPEDATA